MHCVARAHDGMTSGLRRLAAALDGRGLPRLTGSKLPV